MSLTQIRLNDKVKNPRNLVAEQELKSVTKAAKVEEMFNNKVREYNQSLQGLYSSIKPQLEIKNKIQEDEKLSKTLNIGRYKKTELEKEAEIKKEAEENAKQAKQVRALEELLAKLDAGFGDVTRTLINLLNNGVVHHDAVIRALDELDKNGKINNNTQTLIIDEIKKNGDVSEKQLEAVKEVLNYNKATLKEIENLKDVTSKSVGIMVGQKLGQMDFYQAPTDVTYDNVHDTFFVKYQNTQYPFSKPAFQQLIENQNDFPTDLGKIDIDDTLKYGRLLRARGMGTDRVHEIKNPTNRIYYNNMVLSCVQSNWTDATSRPKIEQIFRTSSTQAKTGQGLL